MVNEEVLRHNEETVWQPPTNGNEAIETQPSPVRSRSYYIKKSAQRLNRSTHQYKHNLGRSLNDKREVRERRKESNTLLKTIQEYTSVKVINKVQEILQCKLANVNTTDSAGQTPLMYVIRYQRDDKCLRLISILLSHGATLNAKDLKGRGLLHLAIKYENYLAAVHLIKTYPSLDVSTASNKDETPLKMCIRIGESALDVIQTLLDTKRAGINTIIYRAGSKYQSALHIAAEKGSLPILRLLMRNEANIDAQDEHGRTALHMAAVNLHANAVKELLLAGANLSIVDREGRTPAQLAAHKYYGTGLETMNAFVNFPRIVRQNSSMESYNAQSPPKRCSTQTQADSLPEVTVVREPDIVVEPIIEEPEVYVKQEAESINQTRVGIVELTNDEDLTNEEPTTASSNQFERALVPWKPPTKPKVLHMSRRSYRPHSYKNRTYNQRRSVYSYSRVVRSRNRGSRKQTLFFDVQAPRSPRNYR